MCIYTYIYIYIFFFFLPYFLFSLLRLIEINSSPSLTADTPTDYELKFGLLDDLYTVIDSENKLGGATEECVGGFDLIYNNGLPKADNNSCYTTKLGCFDDRVRNLKKLHKAHAKRAAVAHVATPAGAGGGGGR